jgi:phosphomannomutase/phosphoglucomutase
MSMDRKNTLEKVPPEIFRAYDIRGEVGEDGITPELAYPVGRAVASEVRSFGSNEVIVGRDGRLSGPSLKAALVEGLCDSGTNVIDIGIVPTPLVYFATHRLSTSFGVMVTGSHNPKNHNGFKIVLNRQTLSTEGVQKIYRRIVAEDFVEISSCVGSIKNINIEEDYIQYVLNQIKLAKPMRIVIDCGNGAAAVLASRLFQRLGCEVTELFCTLDGSFPNHHPDPTIPENLQDLIARVQETSADVGLAFDGDADRLGVVSNKGEIIWPDRQLMLFARDMLQRLPGSDIVFDVKCSSNLARLIEKEGGHPVMSRTGHSLLRKKMIECNAPLAGEMSGHIFFKENWFGFDDGIYAGARLLSILSNSPYSASEVFESLPNSINTPELKLAISEDKKMYFMEQLIKNSRFENAKRVTVDGLRVEFEYGWGLVRASNTSPYLTLRFEADSVENLEKIKKVFRAELLRMDPELALPF